LQRGCLVQVSVDVRVPRKGEYGLEIFANDPEKEGDMFTHVCQFLCVYVDGRVEDLYGKPPERTEVKPVTADDLAVGPATPEAGDSLHITTF